MERQNRSVLKAIRAAHAEGKNWREELNKFLLAYRSTPYSTTGKSPAEFLFRRTLKAKMPDLTYVDEEIEGGNQAARDHDAERKQANKGYTDKKHRAADRDVREGDTVLLEQRRENKLSPVYEKEPYEVLARYGDQVELKSPQGVQYKRNLQHIKPFNVPESQVTMQQKPGFATEMSFPQVNPTPATPATTAADRGGAKASEIPFSASTEPPPPEVPVPSTEEDPSAVRRSGRIPRCPQAWNDYVLQ